MTEYCIKTSLSSSRRRREHLQLFWIRPLHFRIFSEFYLDISLYILLPSIGYKIGQIIQVKFGKEANMEMGEFKTGLKDHIPLEKVKEYKYLGIWINSKGNLDIHITH